MRSAAPLLAFLLCCANTAPAYGATESPGHSGMHDPGAPLPTPAKTAPHGAMMDPREASGTAWQPAASPLYAHHYAVDRWDLMLHYNAFLAYNHQDGPRGDDQWGSINWAMLMGIRPLGQGTLALRGMFSLERVTTGGDGYPLLFQTGETWRDEPLVDRQHPHDFFMELAVRYDQPLSDDIRGFLYAAPVGEPALGPVAYPHRASAFEFPLAPLGHHWQDSSHITFGVITAGLQGRKWKAEVSSFTGREPDENRWDFDPIRLDSYAGRLTYNPDDRWSLSGSYGDLKDPEPLHAGVDLERRVLAAMYARPWGSQDRFDATAIWGRNSTEGGAFDSYLVEGTYTHRAHHLFLRWEATFKTGEELALEPHDETHRITTGTLGYVYDFYRRRVVAGVGAGVAFQGVPAPLRAAYGEDPVSYLAFLRVRPSGASVPRAH